MNERIKQLAQQAGLLPREIGPVVETRHMKKKEQDLDKFAELIVRMCADAADMYEGKSDCVGDCVAEYMGYGQEEGVTEWRSK